MVSRLPCSMPTSVWLSGFFNPQSFLTAIMQSTARKNELPLDKMSLVCEVTKKNKEEVTAPPREGAYIHGLFMEGARYVRPSPLITVHMCVQGESSHSSGLGPTLG